MREPIALGYLLARTSDTIADSSSADLPQRLSLLEQLNQAVATTGPDSVQLDPTDLGITHLGEQQLLQSLDQILVWLHELDSSDRTIITEVLGHIIAGQSWDLEFFDQPNPSISREQLLTYTYQVAGCVGEFWTEVGYLRLGDRFAPAEHREAMLITGKKLGQGLQLINIIRDQYEDLPKGRSYLPGEESAEQKTQHWLAVCRQWVSAAPQYLEPIRNRRVRIATALPFELALATAEQLNQAGPEMILREKVKVPRSQVRKILATTAIQQFLKA